MPLQFRRGPDSDRLTITPVVAEPVFTTDTKRLFVGDGSTVGGIEIQGSVDSAATIALIDSAYVQARSPLTTTADFPDSAGVNTLIDARVNASFINALTIDADTLGGQAASTYLQTTADFPDSAGVNTLIDARVNASFINNLTIDADTLGGQAASTYLQTTADFPDSAGVNSLIDTRVNATFINNLTIDADTLGGQAGSYYLNYNNFTNTPTIPTLSTDFVDSAEGRKLISVTDAGGDGSLAYNNSTGVLTYTGPSAAEVRAHFSGGTGVTYTSGTGAIAIGQAVGTTDSVTFGGLYVSGNLMVSGTTTTINSTTLTVDDKNIVLADGAADANAADSGGITIAGANAQLFYKSTTDAWNFNKDLAMGGNDVSGVGRLTATGAISTTDSAVFGGNGSTGGVKIDDGAITIRTATGNVAAVDFYCEVNNQHRVRLKAPAHANFSGNPDVVLPNASGTIALTSAIPTNNNTLTNGAGYITASSTETLTNKSGNISMFTNDANYLDSTYTSALVDSAYVQARVTAGTDSAATISLINATVDSAYVQLRQSGGAITVQEEGVSLATSATTLNFVGGNVTASGTGATKTITITGGSGSGGGGSGISRADFFHYTATNGQTSFTGLDDDSQTLSYTPARAAVYLNGILLRDSADYTSTSGDAIVLATGADSNDIVTIINQGGLDSSLVTGIVDSAYVAARAGGATGGTDSAAVIALIDSSYIQARQSTVSAGATTISTTSFTATDNQTTFATDYTVGKINTYLNGVLLVDSADYTASNGSSIVLSTGADSNDILQVVKYTTAAIAGGLDSALTTQLIDSAYVTARAGAGTDSAAVIALIDSDYVQARQTATTPVTVTADIFSYTASNAQTAFSGTDNNNKTLAYTPDNVNVFLNGILLVDSDDYTATSGSLVTLVSAASAGDNIQITGYNTTGTARETAFSTFTYTADSGQTAFTGASEEGTSLQYTSRAQIYLNGILLKDSDDYTRTSSSTLTLTEAADSSDIIQIHDFSDVRVSSNLINKNYEYTADSGQTTFSGADNNSATLSYQSGYIQVFLNGILLREADYTANNGSSVVLAEAADSGNTLTISKYGYGTTNPSTVATWTERSATATAVAGEKLFIDCSSGVVTVNLPSSPDMGSEIRVIDATGNAATNNITIGRNGSKINGADSDLTLDVNRAAIGLVYYNTAQGWILMER